MCLFLSYQAQHLCYTVMNRESLGTVLVDVLQCPRGDHADPTSNCSVVFGMHLYNHDFLFFTGILCKNTTQISCVKISCVKIQHKYSDTEVPVPKVVKLC